MNQPNKSRDIPLTTLYFNLQVEFLSYFIRGKIYCKDFSENYKIISSQKKEKIEKISEKNDLPSIFNNPSTKDEFISYFLKEKGVPNFCYKDEVIKHKMGIWDINYYFFKGTSVKYLYNGQWGMGVIIRNNKYDKTLIIKDQFGSEVEIHQNLVSRVFPDNFWNI